MYVMHVPHAWELPLSYTLPPVADFWETDKPTVSERKKPIRDSIKSSTYYLLSSHSCQRNIIQFHLGCCRLTENFKVVILWRN